MSRYSRDPFPSQMRTFWSDNDVDDVLPVMNHSSSAVTARKKTRFVVRSGRIRIGLDGSVEGRESSKRNWRGANREYVPVPVLGLGQSQYCVSEYQHTPVRPMFAVVKNVSDQI